MKQIKTLLAALFVAMAGTASAQLTNYVHITKTDGTRIELSQAEIQSMTIDTEAPAEELKFVTFNDGTNTVKVAKMNLGATSIADGTSCYGDYYAWGATEPFGTVSYTAYNAGTVTATKDGGYTEANAPYYENGAYIKYTSASTLDDGDDAVKVNMPGYHMPTREEIQVLYNACGGSGSTPTGTISANQAYPTIAGIYWVTGGNAAVKIGDDTYSVNGLLFVQDATHHVFFPAAGYVDGTTLNHAGSDCRYWSSSHDEDLTHLAYYLYFGINGVHTAYSDDRYRGFTVRPFKD